MRQKIPDLGSFQLEFENSIVIIEISTLNFCLLAKFREKKRLNLEGKIPDLSIFGLEFENSIVIFEISTPEFV